MENDDNLTVLGIHPCCQQKALRYDSIDVLTVSITITMVTNNNIETMVTCYVYGRVGIQELFVLHG